MLPTQKEDYEGQLVEQAIISAAMLNNDIIPDIKDALKPSDFYAERHRVLAQAIFAMHDAGIPIDLLTLHHALTSKGQLEKAGGAEYLSSLADAVSTSAGYKAHIDILKGIAGKRHLTAMLTDTLDLSRNGRGVPELLEGLKDKIAEIEKGSQSGNEIKLVRASDWLTQTPPEPDQVIEGLIETGDKLCIIGSAKQRKSFFTLQGGVSIAAGRDFLDWHIPQARRVLYCQFEIKDDHMHRRVKRMASALGIKPEDIEDKFMILNGRGLNLSGPEGVNKIWRAAEAFKPEVILLDPLYKLSDGVENSAEGLKVILNAFDQLIEQSGAALIFIHHDSKGFAGDRLLQDRGAGSNILGRDYDSCLTLTAHATEQATVIESLLRNYPPQEPVVIQWTETDGGYCFQTNEEILPQKQTSKTRQEAPTDMNQRYLKIALGILDTCDGDQYEIQSFKERLRKQLGIGEKKLAAFIKWATSSDHPYLCTKEVRGDCVHKKWIYKNQSY